MITSRQKDEDDKTGASIDWMRTCEHLVRGDAVLLTYFVPSCDYLC